jgi:hypothetical protein
VVVGDIELYRVYWLQEKISVLLFAKVIHKPLGGFLPVVTYQGVLGYLGDLKLVYCFFAVKIQSHFWILGLPLLEFFFVHGLVVAVPQYCQDVLTGHSPLINLSLRWLGWFFKDLCILPLRVLKSRSAAL